MTMNTHSNNINGPSDALLENLERALIAGRMSRRGFMRAATAAGFASVGLSALADELDAIRANQNARSAKLQSWSAQAVRALRWWAAWPPARKPPFS